MIEFSDLRVVSFSIEYQDVYWDIKPTTEDVQDYDFHLERSESMGGPWQELAKVVDRYYVRDNAIPLHNTNRVLFYRVRAVHRRTDKEIVSEIASRQGKLPLDGAEIVRLENVLFREHVGVHCWLFPLRTFGQRCPQCWDKALRKATDDNCPTCWGTGFSGGYHYPVGFWGQVDPSDNADQVTASTHLQSNYTAIKMGPAPAVKPLDLVVDNQNTRWKVSSVSYTARLGVAIRQQLSVVRVTKGSIEDAIPLRVDNETVQLVPEREYTNPHVPGAGTDLSDILGAYGIH